jgi:hypothetical protein
MPEEIVPHWAATISGNFFEQIMFQICLGRTAFQQYVVFAFAHNFFSCLKKRRPKKLLLQQ